MFAATVGAQPIQPFTADYDLLRDGKLIGKAQIALIMGKDVVKGPKVYGFRIANQSNQPVPVMLKGMDQPIGIAMPGQNTYFAWSFDVWNTWPNALMLGNASVPIYIGPEPYNT